MGFRFPDGTGSVLWGGLLALKTELRNCIVMRTSNAESALLDFSASCTDPETAEAGACIVVSNVRFRNILSPAIWRISVHNLSQSVSEGDSKRSTRRRRRQHNPLLRSVLANNWLIGQNANGICFWKWRRTKT